MTRKEYVEKTVSGIKSKSLRREVEEELSDHLDELKQLWIGRGFHPLDAEEKAVEEMGAPEKTAEELGAVHSKARYITSEIFTVLLILFWGALAAGMVFYTLLLNTLGFSSLLLKLEAELVFVFCGGFLLLFAKRKNAPFISGATALAVMAHILFVLGPILADMAATLVEGGDMTFYDGFYPASPSVLFLAAAVTGHYGDLTAQITSQVYAASPVLTVISVVMYILWFAAALIIFITGIKRKKRRCGKKAVRYEKIAARIAAAICALILLAGLPPLVGTICETVRADNAVYFDGWYLLQCDAQEDNVSIPAGLWDLPEDAYYIEIDRDFGPFLLLPKNFDHPWGDSETVRWADASVDGLFDVYAEVAEWELEEENRYLFAVPADAGRLSPEYAAWFDLADPKPIYLPIGTLAEERYNLIKIVTVGH